MKQKVRSEFWREQIRLASESGGTAKEYCRQNGLSLASFYSWRKKLKAVANSKSLSPFVEVQVIQEKANRLPDSKWVAEIIHHLAYMVQA